ncbi:MAG TPA: HAMP domain-containing sensor histidine kinase [Cyclobacteriaceae bacterium]|nr:HAMP domain-containing sensor histidine kinase [Cyclobacteriaceae bacterium]
MKLLKRTVKNYILYSALLLLICTPLYYLSIHRLFVNEMEEELFHHKNNFKKTLDKLENEKDIQLYQLINEEFQLKETSKWPISDSLFTYSQYDSLEKTFVPYRALRTGVTVQGTRYELLIRESIVGNTKLVTAIVAIQTTLLVLMLIGFILINRKLSKVVWDPFYTILEKLKNYQIDKDLTIDLPHSSTAEFRDLSEALVHLVNKSRDAYLSQKEFTENASHELQTPLAIFRSKLELLMQGADISSEQAELISSLLNATDRIVRLNKNLLLLSKIENRQFLSRQEILLSSALTQSLGLYKQMAQEKEIKITTHIISEIAVKTNPSLLEILLSNLISNAIRYTPAQNEVRIEIEKKSITIRNPGEPFNFPNKIFDRFNRESRTTQGNGLGLAIVKKICDTEGIPITYHYSQGSHLFSIDF